MRKQFIVTTDGMSNTVQPSPGFTAHPYLRHPPSPAAANSASSSSSSSSSSFWLRLLSARHVPYHLRRRRLLDVLAPARVAPLPASSTTSRSEGRAAVCARGRAPSPCAPAVPC